MSKFQPKLIGSCRISNCQIHKNTNLIFKSDYQSFATFADECYTHFKLAYPKFHKMDKLSKLGWLCADILLNNTNLAIKYDPFKVGVVLSNKNSSLDTDIKYYNMLKTGVASPAVFVYSLPNIVIGEICIRHGIKGANTFFISERFNIPQQFQYVNHLLKSSEVDACIGGWVELLDDNYEAFFYLVEKSDITNGNEYTIKNIEALYNNRGND